MSACRRYREWLIDSLDGTLAADAAGRLQAHLDRCPACAQALEDLRRTRDLVRSLPPVEPPDWLKDRILVRIKTGQAPRRRARPGWLRPSLPAAALVMLGLTGYLVYRNPHAPGPPAAGPTPPSAQEAAVPGTPAPASGLRPSASPAVPAGPGAPAHPASTPPPPPAPQAGATPPGPSATMAEAVPAGPPAARTAATPTGTLAAKAEAAAPAPPAAQGGSAPAGAPVPPRAADQAEARANRRPVLQESAAPLAKAAPASLALTWEPDDTIRASSQAVAAFTAAGAAILSRPGPDYRGITARVPATALDALLERLQALGPLQDAPARPTRMRGEVLVTMTW